jgi:hypothetical protein
MADVLEVCDCCEGDVVREDGVCEGCGAVRADDGEEGFGRYVQRWVCLGCGREEASSFGLGPKLPCKTCRAMWQEHPLRFAVGRNWALLGPDDVVMTGEASE